MSIDERTKKLFDKLNWCVNEFHERQMPAQAKAIGHVLHTTWALLQIEQSDAGMTPAEIADDYLYRTMVRNPVRNKDMQPLPGSLGVVINDPNGGR